MNNFVPIHDHANNLRIDDNRMHTPLVQWNPLGIPLSVIHPQWNYRHDYDSGRHIHKDRIATRKQETKQQQKRIIFVSIIQNEKRCQFDWNRLSKAPTIWKKGKKKVWVVCLFVCPSTMNSFDRFGDLYWKYDSVAHQWKLKINEFRCVIDSTCCSFLTNCSINWTYRSRASCMIR